jgi:predicted ATPase
MAAGMSNMLLRAIEMQPPDADAPAVFPYTVPFVRAFEKIEFETPVTLLVGENGSGKSTFLEALACAVDSITVGGQPVSEDETLAPVRAFAETHLRLVWSKRTRKGFFMRSEDFFNYAKHMTQTRAEMEADLRRVEDEYKDRSITAQNYARSAFSGQAGQIKRDYGDGLDANSHGEGFFKLFRRRFVGEGLYLLDEPEAPLSPTSQLSLLSMIKLMADQGGQFVIATHSPILLAFPNATILSFDDGALNPVDYESLEHVNVMRSFLNDPQAYLKYLMNPDD